MHNPYLLRFLESEGYKDYEEYQEIEKLPRWDRLSRSIKQTGKLLENFSNLMKKFEKQEFISEENQKEIAAITADKGPLGNRFVLVEEFAWAVPNENAIDEITEFLNGQTVVDIACGTGYWSYLLKQKGNNVISVDIEPRDKPWADTLSLNAVTLHRKLDEFQNSALMFCWPPYADPMAFKTLKTYKGNKVIYIGEGHGGCTADDAFHELLWNQFELVKEVNIPQFNGLHDKMWFFERNNNA